MSSYVFMGWVENDALKVLKRHMPQIFENEIDFQSNNLTVMVENVAVVKTHIKKSKFKRLGFTVISSESDPMYILYLGKLCEHTCQPGQNSILSIPMNIMNTYSTYVSAIAEKKLKRTKYPEFFNVFGVPHVVSSLNAVTPNSVTQSSKEESEDASNIADPDDITKSIVEREKRLGLLSEVEESEIMGEPKPKKKARSRKVSLDVESEESESIKMKKSSDKVSSEEIVGSPREEETPEEEESQQSETPEENKTKSILKPTKKRKNKIEDPDFDSGSFEEVKFEEDVETPNPEEPPKPAKNLPKKASKKGRMGKAARAAMNAKSRRTTGSEDESIWDF